MRKCVPRIKITPKFLVFKEFFFVDLQNKFLNLFKNEYDEVKDPFFVDFLVKTASKFEYFS